MRDLDGLQPVIRGLPHGKVRLHQKSARVKRGFTPDTNLRAAPQ